MPHTPLPPFAATSGPRNARIVCVGEAFGQHESELRKPFVGESGKEFFLMLGEAMPLIALELHTSIVSQFRYGLAWTRHRDEWLSEASICLTNVLALRPPNNKIDSLCVPKSELPDKGKTYELPSLVRGKYLQPEYLPELRRLFVEINEISPNLIVALGNTACWALLRATNIGSIRGTITKAIGKSDSQSNPSRCVDYKILPTFHPASVLYQWSSRPIVVADLMKAYRESQFPEIRRPSRQVLTSPSLAEANIWALNHIFHSNPQLISCDIETHGGQISCIGFATSRSEALVIPFIDLSKSDGSYWKTSNEELAAWKLVQSILESPIPKLFQNGMYDLQYITRLGFQPRNCLEDTMLLHHSLFPELRKGLGFLGSIYTDEPAWKLMRRQRPDTEKRDE